MSITGNPNRGVGVSSYAPGSLYLRTDNGTFYWKYAGVTWTVNTT